MKIKITNKNLTSQELSYIGISIVEHLVSSYQENPNFLTLAAIIEEMEIIFNNFIELEKDVKKHFGIGYDFTLYRNEIAHASSLKSLLRQNQDIVKYFQEKLLPIKQKIESNAMQSKLCDISFGTNLLPSIDFQSLYSEISKSIVKIMPKREAHFIEATTEAFCALYFLEKYPNSLEVAAFARLAVCCIREKYAVLIDDKEALGQLFRNKDPFYEMLHIRRLFAHEKYPDLAGQNPTIFLANLLDAVGITEVKYQKIKNTIEGTSHVKKRSTKEKVQTEEVLNTKFSALEIEENSHIEEEEDSTNNDNSTNKQKQKHKNKQKKKQSHENEDDEILKEAQEFNDKLKQSQEEEQNKLDMAFKVQNMFELSKQLSCLFVGIVALYQKIGIADELSLQGKSSLEIKYHLLQKALEIGNLLSKDCNKHYIDQKGVQDIVKLLKFATENIRQGGYLIDKIIKKLGEEYIPVVISNDLFDPNIQISCERLMAPSIQHSNTREGYIMDFDNQASVLSENFSAAKLSYLAPFNLKLLEVVLSKGSFEAKSQLLKDFVFRVNPKYIEEFCKICVKENVNLKDFLNSHIMTIDFGAQVGSEDVAYITPLEALEKKVIEKLYMHNKYKSPLEIDEHLRSIQILMKYGADISHHSDDMKKLNKTTYSNENMELKYRSAFCELVCEFTDKDFELGVLGEDAYS